ncbi:mitogen-activated protein kinase kinase kinase 4-like [Saccostrea echinata]|uniref:mitogen-activated protein kinase kinase kinase 4-like n=1 Tax=Saccostrea echinata TaxID=191078 RepID=UPI002A821B57|nr:mitogen-activated protein kinase kinase kinase 4-like [Saccostrea echinata]
MADRDFRTPLSTTPNEDFNPLAEEQEDFNSKLCLQNNQEHHDADCSGSDDETDSQCTSIEEMPAGILYSVTPPTNIRGVKRDKKKQQTNIQKQSYKQYTELKKAKKSLRNAVIKERYANDPMFCKLGHIDSDDNLEKDFADDKDKRSMDSRDLKKKSMTKTIAHERLAKRNSSDLASIDTTTVDVPVPQAAAKVDTSGRFSSLNFHGRIPIDSSGRFASLNLKSHALSSMGQSLSSSWNVGRSEHRRQSVVNVEVPKERVDFFKIFSTLINMGSHSKKEKDVKGVKDKMSYRRQISSEQELWQERYKDYLWLELQMDQHGFKTLNEQEEYLKMQREKIPDVLEEILNFKFDCSLEQFERSEEESSFSIQNNENTPYSFTLTSETVAQQREALIYVQELLNKLDACEQLFPTSKAFAKEFEMYSNKQFTQQVKSLYLWQSITKDLCHKIRKLGLILGAQHASDYDWPEIDLDSPRFSEDFDFNCFSRQNIPKIEEPSCVISEDELENTSESFSTQTENAKRVTFTLNSTRSSRNTSPVNSEISYKGLRTTYSSGNLSRASSEASLDELHHPPAKLLFRKYVDKTLKRMGMNKMLLRFKELLDRTLQRAREALQRPKIPSNSDIQSPEVDGTVQLSSSPALDLHYADANSTSVNVFHRSSSLTDIGAWSEHFIQMGLPSFQSSYLFLLHVFLEVIHEAMRLRLEQRPVIDPSFLSIRPLLRECKEVLRGAVIVKQYFQTMVDDVSSEGETNIMKDLGEFDDDVRKMLDVYFTYLQSWMLALQSLPEASLSLKNVLESEWLFTKQICPHVIGGEAEAGKRFSSLASSLLNSIADFLESGIDDFTTSLYNLTINEDNEEVQESTEKDTNNNNDSDNNDEVHEQQKLMIQEIRHLFQQTSRNCKKLFNEARERASKALGFAKALRKDLEIAADFNIAVTTVELLAKLKTTNFVMVNFASNDPGYLVFIPSRIADNRHLILQLLNVTCGREDLSASIQDLGSLKEDGYLLMVCCEGGKGSVKDCPLWFGQVVKVDPTAETAIALSHIQVEGLLLVVIHSSQLSAQRKEFESLMGKTVQLVNEQTSCHQAIAESLTELKGSAMELQERVVQAIKQVDDKFYCEDMANFDDNERNHLLNLYRETMLKGYNFGFEYLREVTRLVTGETKQKLSKRLVNFAKEWMAFVTEKCEKGRGMRPKWASQGLDFLIVACEPKVLACLTDEEYQELKKSINSCISHVIGSADRTPVSPTHSQGSSPIPRSSSVDSGRQPYLRYPSWPAEQAQGKFTRSTSNISNKSSQSEPPPNSTESRVKRHSMDYHSEVDVHDGDDGGIVLDINLKRNFRVSGDIEDLKPLDRRKQAILRLEERRLLRLRDSGVIGVVTSRKIEPDYRISVRRVNFRWQRGLKIGEGQFGKVYSAVNMDNGELMAMKEMKFQANDHQALKELADEIILFEGIQHPNLVKYYGVEVHRDEMLVFMEYCDRGTLEEAAKMGLPEHNIRVYTREILLAVNHLHENNILHRDIKGANIFLTSSGCLKLGDFGCSEKLKSHATLPGEFNSLVGTMAYMAPEVITRNASQGHGRAADIWSLGCVVIEMSAGKRPWHELENSAQIMFKVGMGGKPQIPESLSAEGKDFLVQCFKSDPTERSTAAELLDHPFVKVQVEEQDGET